MLLSAVLKEARQPQEALRCLDQARTILKAAGNTYNLATACQITSWVHYDQGRLPEALGAVDEAWKHARLIESVPIQATVSHKRRLRMTLGRDRGLEIEILGDGNCMKALLEYIDATRRFRDSHGNLQPRMKLEEEDELGC